jgi:hypothetical protein
MKIYLKIALLSVISSQVLAQPAKVSRSAILFKEPSSSSSQISNLAPGRAINIQDKKGFWVKVDASGQVGWVKLSDLELPNVTNNINPLSTGRSASGNIVNTAGARGLSPEELKNSKPNPSAVVQAIQDSEKITDADVVKFMVDGGISQRSNIPDVKSVKVTASGNSSAVNVSEMKKSAPPKKSKNDSDEW